MGQGRQQLSACEKHLQGAWIALAAQGGLLLGQGEGLLFQGVYPVEQAEWTARLCGCLHRRTRPVSCRLYLQWGS